MQTQQRKELSVYEKNSEIDQFFFSLIYKNALSESVKKEGGGI